MGLRLTDSTNLFAVRCAYLHVVLGVQAVDEARQAAQEPVRCCPLWPETELNEHRAYRQAYGSC